MRTDLYTKTVLTVIALALVWICVRPIVMPERASAQSGPPKVMLVDPAGKPIIVRTPSGAIAIPVQQKD